MKHIAVFWCHTIDFAKSISSTGTEQRKHFIILLRFQGLMSYLWLFQHRVRLLNAEIEEKPTPCSQDWHRVKLGDLLLYRMTNGSNSTDGSLPKISISAHWSPQSLKHVNLIFLHLNVMKVNRGCIFFSSPATKPRVTALVCSLQCTLGCLLT